MSEPAHILDHDRLDWPAPGEWTYQDCLRLQNRSEEGRRFEVIRGFLYVTATPTWLHQHAVWRLGYFFQEFVRKHRLGTVAGAPFDILLPNKIGDPVQPDLFYFRTGNEPSPEDNHFAGVPDLVAEVLSRSTRRRDRKDKLEAYRDAGVSEYWLVDPQTRTVTVYGLSEDRASYVELARGGEGERINSAVLPGMTVEVSNLFP